MYRILTFGNTRYSAFIKICFNVLEYTQYTTSKNVICIDISYIPITYTIVEGTNDRDNKSFTSGLKFSWLALGNVHMIVGNNQQKADILSWAREINWVCLFSFSAKRGYQYH